PKWLGVPQPDPWRRTRNKSMLLAGGRPEPKIMKDSSGATVGPTSVVVPSLNSSGCAGSYAPARNWERYRRKRGFSPYVSMKYTLPSATTAGAKIVVLRFTV